MVDLHLEKEALRLTDRGVFSCFEPVKGNDARDAGPDIRHARKNDEGVLHIPYPRNQRIRNKYKSHSNQTDGASYSLQQYQHPDLLCGEVLNHRRLFFAHSKIRKEYFPDGIEISMTMSLVFRIQIGFIGFEIYCNGNVETRGGKSVTRRRSMQSE